MSQHHVPYRTLLIDLTRRDFKTRYLGSLLGSYWNIIHPLVMIFIYTVVFSRVMRAKLGGADMPFSYSIYLCAGLVPWTLFSEIVTRGASTLNDNALFLKKLPLPPYLLFFVTVMTAWINFLITFSFFFLVLLYLMPLSPLLTIEYLVVALFLTLFAWGLALGLGCLNVFMRDFQQLTTILFQLWFWFTPIVYTVAALPEFAKKLVWFNPAFVFIHSLQQLLFYRQQPTLQSWGLMTLWSLGSMAFGLFIYARTKNTLRDYL